MDVFEHDPQAEIWDASVGSTDLESVSDWSDINEEQRATWLQRFQKMEMALQMCDTRNTGIKPIIQIQSLQFKTDLKHCDSQKMID